LLQNEVKAFAFSANGGETPTFIVHLKTGMGCAAADVNGTTCNYNSEDTGVPEGNVDLFCFNAGSDERFTVAPLQYASSERQGMLL
jgi:hypothetical protein